MKKFKVLKTWISLFAFTTTFCGFSAYADAPTAGDILRNDNEILKNQIIPKKIPKELLKKNEIVDTLEGDQKILVKKFEFTGELEFVSIDILEDLIKDFNNSELNFGEIQAVVNVINRYFQNQGYLVARAYLPKQEVRDKVIYI